MGWSPWLSNSGRASSRKLAFFAVYLWQYGWNASGKGNQYSTIQAKLSSVYWFHRRFCDVELGRSPQLKVLLQGIKRMSDPTAKKMPITPAFLRILRRSLHLSRPRDRLLWGSVLLGFFFLLRRSEYLKIGNTRSFYCLRMAEVNFTDSRGNPVEEQRATAVTIGLRGAKNDQFGRGAWRSMHQSGDQQLCPVRALQHVLRARQALGRANHKYLCADLSAHEVNTAIKNAAIRARVSPANYSTHSLRRTNQKKSTLRSGGATALMTGKVDGLSIKLLGRWLSRCFEEYPMQAADSTIDLSSRMILSRPAQARASTKHGGR
eukprot:jgi/Phyca11/123449/e_gw1.50.278.1